MSKRKRRYEECCCKKVDPCCEPCCDPCCDNGFGDLLGGFGDNSLLIFLLIACGTGSFNSNKSQLIMLLFLLCGKQNIFGGNNCCC